MDEEDPTALSIGSILGGSSPWMRRWGERISALSRSVREAREGVESPINVNVVFLVPGNALRPDFDGIRTGRFSRKLSWLIVQVALPEEAPEDVDGHLKRALLAAIDEAERWAKKRKRAENLQSLRDLVDGLP